MQSRNQEIFSSALTTADAGARPDGVAAVEDAEGAGPSNVATVLDYES